MTDRIAIVGAGPAGSAAALLLARRGSDVTLIEQHRFPRDKVCGECLSAVALDCLKRMGLSDAFGRLGPVELTHATIHPPEGRSIRLKLGRAMAGLSRRRLDAFLLESARAAGARVLQPARCEGIDPGAPVTLHLRSGGVRHVESHSFPWVVMAEGKAVGGERMPTGDFGIKAHFENVDGPRDSIELFGCGGLYGGLAAIEESRWNAAFAVPAARLRRHRGNVAAVFEQIAGENPTLARRLTGARQTGPWLAAPLPRFAVAGAWPRGIIPVGNAAAALEPIGGEGMGLALRSAELAADCLAPSDANPDLNALHRQYRRLWNVRRPACRAAALLVSRPALAGEVAHLLNTFPVLARAALVLMGKSE